MLMHSSVIIKIFEKIYCNVEKQYFNKKYMVNLFSDQTEYIDETIFTIFLTFDEVVGIKNVFNNLHLY